WWRRSRTGPAACTPCACRASPPCAPSSTSSGTRPWRASRSWRADDSQVDVAALRSRARLRAVHRARVDLVAGVAPPHRRCEERDSPPAHGPLLGARGRRPRGRARARARMAPARAPGARLLPGHGCAAPHPGGGDVRGGRRGHPGDGGAWTDARDRRALDATGAAVRALVGAPPRRAGRERFVGPLTMVTFLLPSSTMKLSRSLCTLPALALAAWAGPARAESRQHDGFYLRLGMGGGFAVATLATAADSNSHGADIATELAAGWSLR